MRITGLTRITKPSLLPITISIILVLGQLLLSHVTFGVSTSGDQGIDNLVIRRLQILEKEDSGFNTLAYRFVVLNPWYRLLSNITFPNALVIWSRANGEVAAIGDFGFWDETKGSFEVCRMGLSHMIVRLDGKKLAEVTAETSVESRGYVGYYYMDVPGGFGFPITHPASPGYVVADPPAVNPAVDAFMKDHLKITLNKTFPQRGPVTKELVPFAVYVEPDGGHVYTMAGPMREWSESYDTQLAVRVHEVATNRFKFEIARLSGRYPTFTVEAYGKQILQIKSGELTDYWFATVSPEASPSIQAPPSEPFIRWTHILIAITTLAAILCLIVVSISRRRHSHS